MTYELMPLHWRYDRTSFARFSMAVGKYPRRRCSLMAEGGTNGDLQHYGIAVIKNSESGLLQWCLYHFPCCNEKSGAISLVS